MDDRFQIYYEHMNLMDIFIKSSSQIPDNGSLNDRANVLDKS